MQAENSDNQKKSKNSFLNMLYRFWAFIVYYVTFGQVDLLKADKKAEEQEKQLAEKEQQRQKQLAEVEKEKEQERQKQLVEQVTKIKDRTDKIKFIKEKDKFTKQKQEDQNEMEADAIKADAILDCENKGKALFYKAPTTDKDRENLANNPDYQKFKNSWMSKSQLPYNTIREILSSEPIRMLVGEDFAPKYRLKKQEDGSFIVMTKMLKNFTPWCMVVDNNLGKKDFRERNEKRTELYINTTAQLENFERMVAVCMLFGKSDIHSGNWGIVEKDGKKYAANLDHEQAFTDSFREYKGTNDNVYSFMYHYGHRKERIVTEKFAKTCFEVIEDFEKNKDTITEIITKEIKSIEEFITHSNLSVDVNQKMEMLEKSKHTLKMFAYQVKAEMAIMKGNPKLLREALNHLIIGEDGKICLDENGKIKVPAERMLSQQNNRDGFIGKDVKDFEMLIKTRMIKDHEKLFPYLERNPPEADYYSSVKDNYKALMDESDIKIENDLVAVYNEVLEFAKKNQGKTLEEATKSQTSHVDRVVLSRSSTEISQQKSL